MSTNIGEGEISPKVRIFAGTGAILGAVLGGAALGFPALIASTIVLGFAGGFWARISKPERARAPPLRAQKGRRANNPVDPAL